MKVNIVMSETRSCDKGSGADHMIFRWTLKGSQLVHFEVNCSFTSAATGSGMNLLDIRTRTWSEICLEATAPHLDRLLGAPLPSTSVLVRLVHTGPHWSVLGDKREAEVLRPVVAGSRLLLLCASIWFL